MHVKTNRGERKYINKHDLAVEGFMISRKCWALVFFSLLFFPSAFHPPPLLGLNVIKAEILHNQYYVQQFFLPSKKNVIFSFFFISSTCALKTWSIVELFQLYKFRVWLFVLLFILLLMFINLSCSQPRAVLEITNFILVVRRNVLASERDECLIGVWSSFGLSRHALQLLSCKVQ